MSNYSDLEIYQKATELFYRVHPLTLKLPKYELYELGSQLRRSADAVGTNIVEGYGRNKYKADFIRFLVYSHSSNDETIYHLTKLENLYPAFSAEFKELKEEYNILGAKLHTFIKYVQQNWK